MILLLSILVRPVRFLEHKDKVDRGPQRLGFGFSVDDGITPVGSNERIMFLAHFIYVDDMVPAFDLDLHVFPLVLPGTPCPGEIKQTQTV